MESDDDIGTVRWFGPTWNAPVNDPRAEISIPLGESCIRCGADFDHGNRGLGVAASESIAPNGQVFYHLSCFLEEVGVETEREVFDDR